MSSVSSGEIIDEFKHSMIGIIGIAILVILIGISVAAAIFIPVETFQDWNNPGSWIEYPKTSIPVWVNWLPIEKIPEHKILDSPITGFTKNENIAVSSHKFGLDFNYDDFPKDFIYEFTSEYSGAPIITIFSKNNYT